MHFEWKLIICSNDVALRNFFESVQQQRKKREPPSSSSWAKLNKLELLGADDIVDKPLLLLMFSVLLSPLLLAAELISSIVAVNVDELPRFSCCSSSLSSSWRIFWRKFLRPPFFLNKPDIFFCEPDISFLALMKEGPGKSKLLRNLREDKCRR